MQTKNYRWVICVLLFFATTINYIDRQILSLVKEFLDAQFGWSKADFGLVNSLFQGAYGLGLLFFGWFVDRFGVKVGYAVSMVGWSLAAIAHTLVQHLPGNASIQIGGRVFGAAALAVAAFGLCRVLLGLAESGNFPAAVKGTAQWFPRRERAFATSLFNSGANVGALLAPAAVPFLAIHYGWGMPFIVAGVAGFIWLGFWLMMYDVPEQHPKVSAEELEHILSDREPVNGTAKMRWIDLLGYKQVWAIVLARFLTDPVWWFFLIWLPDYFKATRSLDIKHSWPLLVTIYGIITVLSIFGGWVTGHLARSGWSVTRARKTGMFVFALCVLPIFFATRVGDWTSVLLIGLAGAAHQAWSANLYTTVSDMFPKRAVASIVGLGGMAGSMGGMIFPFITGRLLDHYKSAGNETAGYALLFAICAFAYLVAFTVNHLLAPRFEQVELK
jgi:MFS transporter, ACS family, hexuronate transporter